MKISQNFVLRQVADTWVILPVGDVIADFDHMMTLNEIGAAIWRQLDEGYTKEQIAKNISSEYDVSYDQALEDVEKFVSKLVNFGCLE